VKHDTQKNCASNRIIFDSDSCSFAGWKLGSRHFSGNLGIGRNICCSRFFPKQEEKVASIEQIIDFTMQAVFARINILTPKYGDNICFLYP
jgi:hypothetical protein